MTSTITTTDITVGDVVFHVSQTGADNDRTLVFLHGSGPGADALSNWEWVIEQMGDDFHCVAPDIVGFGHSTHPDPPPVGMKPFTDLRVETLLALFDQLGLERVTLVGNSMGGLISMLLANERPELVERMVLMGSAGGKAPMLDGLKQLIGFYREPTADTMEALLRNFLHDPSIFGDDLRGIAEARLPNALRPEVKRSHLATFSQEGGRAGLTMDDYPTLTMSVLLLHGDDDRVVSIGSSEWLTEQLPNARMEVFPDTGHWLQIEKGPEFVAAVTAFMAEEA